jgi:hypothetical protein
MQANLTGRRQVMTNCNNLRQLTQKLGRTALLHPNSEYKGD